MWFSKPLYKPVISLIQPSRQLAAAKPDHGTHSETNGLSCQTYMSSLGNTWINPLMWRHRSCILCRFVQWSNVVIMKSVGEIILTIAEGPGTQQKVIYQPQQLTTQEVHVTYRSRKKKVFIVEVPYVHSFPPGKEWTVGNTSSWHFIKTPLPYTLTDHICFYIFSTFFFLVKSISFATFPEVGFVSCSYFSSLLTFGRPSCCGWKSYDSCS